MRYYIIGTDGNVHGEAGDKATAEILLSLLVDEPDYDKDLELEVIRGDCTCEEDAAAEMNEMIALGWTDEEARENPDAFIQRVGDAAEGMTVADIWRVWAYVWEDHLEDIAG